MAFRRRILEEPKIDLTPMIDVVFLLLIFFMITTTFIEFPGVQIDLPETSNLVSVSSAKEVKVYLAGNGSIYLEKQQVELGDLINQLSSYGAQSAKMTFSLLADQDVLHRRVIAVMDLAKAAGFGKLAIVTEEKPVN